MGRKKPLIPHHKAHLKVLKGDEVLIITGKDRGERGRIEKTFPRSERVIVEGHNLVKAHVKPRQGRPGGIIEKAMPLHVSNVKVICTECSNPTRIGYERVMQGEGANQRLRVRRLCKHCGKPIVDHSRTVRD
jgi:large subunit ribosomal protein L24